MLKKKYKIFVVMEYIYEYFLEIVECKFAKWLNQLKNFFNKHFKEYYLASFCWWISSSCENHFTLVHAHTPFILSTITYKVAVYAPSERADTLYFISTPMYTLWRRLFESSLRASVVHSSKTFQRSYIRKIAHCLWLFSTLCSRDSSRDLAENL